MSKRLPEKDAREETTDRQFVAALARGLSILRCFDRPHIELTVSEIARTVGLSQPTVWRLCYTLIKCGFLVRAPSGVGLRIGAPAITLGYAAAHGLDESAVARPYMQRLHDETRGTATLSLRHGTEVIAMDQINGDFLIRSQPVGWRASLEAVSSGLAVLAALPEGDRSLAVAQIDTIEAEHRLRQSERIEAARLELEREGVVRLEHTRGQYVAVSVPLFETDRSPSAQWALTCGGVIPHWSDSDLSHAARLLVDMRQLLVPAFAVLAGEKF